MAGQVLEPYSQPEWSLMQEDLVHCLVDTRELTTELRLDTRTSLALFFPTNRTVSVVYTPN